jgi:hypothetical protein
VRYPNFGDIFDFSPSLCFTLYVQSQFAFVQKSKLHVPVDNYRNPCVENLFINKDQGVVQFFECCARVEIHCLYIDASTTTLLTDSYASSLKFDDH